MNITNNTLPFSANKRCTIEMGPRQVAVGSVCMLPHSKLTRILSIKDIVMCLNAGATVWEFVSDTETVRLTKQNFANVFGDSHLRYLSKFNINVKSPVEKRESYLIDVPEKPIPPVPVEETKEEAPEATEEPAIEENVPSEETSEGGADLQEESTETEEAHVEETAEETSNDVEETSETEEELEDEVESEEETSEDQPKESRKNRRRNRH